MNRFPTIHFARAVATTLLLLLASMLAAPAWGQSISDVSPTTPYPGHPVTITGSSLSGASDVSYGGTSVTFRQISDSEIRARVPAGATSDASFEVTTSSGSATSSTISLDTGAPYGPERSLTLDGSGDYVEVGDESPFDFTGDFTISFWMKVDGDGFNDDFEALVTKGDDSWRVQRHSNNSELTFDTSHDGGSDFQGTKGSTPVDDGKWHHVAAVYDRSNGEKRLYVDGQLDATASESRAVDDSGFPVRIGSNAEQSGREFGGQIDGVRIYDAVLSTRQVRARARRTIDPGTSGLVAAYRFDASGSTGSAFGFTDNFRHGTFQGDASRTTFSAARLGQESAVTSGSDKSVGPSGGTLSASGVSAGSGEAIQLYRFGEIGASRRTGSDAGEDFSSTEKSTRAALTWGLGTVGSPSATITIDYSGVQNISGSAVLLERSGPGDPWQSATGWTHDRAAQTFTHSGSVPEKQYAVAPGVIFVDKGASGNNDGTSWANAYTDLQTAINNASSDNELWVAEGIYKPDSEGDSFTITGAKDGLSVFGGFAGTETSRSARDPGANPTILSGDLNGDDTDPDGDGVIEDASDLAGGENAHHVLIVDGGVGIGSDVSANVTTATVIDGVIVTAGQADGGNNGDNRVGAGLYCDGEDSGNECSPTLRNVMFAGNAADFTGGAIQNQGFVFGTSSPVITNAVFIGNTASNDGGAIYNNAQEEGTSSPQITNVTFTNNTADLGGAIYNATFSSFGTGISEPQITNVILWGNSAASGGDEIYNDTDAEPTISHSIVQGGDSGIGNGTGFSDGTDNLDQDPQFLEPSRLAGPDGTVATTDDGLNVANSSPALDAGDNAAIPSGVTEDLTGADRTQDRDEDGTATVNIGAYEAGLPVATTGSAQNVAATSADLSGTVDPNGVETTVQAQVLPSSDAAAARSVTASASPLTGGTTQNVTVSLSGLTPNTKYTARIVASNSKGADVGSDVTFITTSDGYARRIKGTDGTGNDAGWRMLALPAADKSRAALEDDLEFDVGSGSILYRWTSGSWTAQTSSSDNLPRGRGWMLYFFDDPFETIDSKGISLAVSTGSEDQSADKTVSSLSTSEDFHLLGNPFDAAFDLSALNLSSQGFQTTVQIWDPSAGSYTQVTQAGDDSDVIGTWQGLFVERDPNASTAGTSLTFSTSGKQTGNGSLIGSKSMSLLAGGAERNTTSKQAETKWARLALRLTVTGEASGGDTTPPGPSGKSAAGMPALAPPARDTSNSRASAKEATPDTLATNRATVLFAEAATAGWDAYEASQLTPFNSGGYATLSSPLLRVASSQEDSTLVRRALASEPYPTDTSAVRLPLSVRSVGTAGEATIGWPEDSRDRLPEEWTVELIDTEAGKRVDLRAEPYSFELADGDGEVSFPADSRFRLAVGPASAVPVELAGFEAQAVAEESVRLTWKTTSEQDNAGFAVQRKGERERGGQGVWMKVGFVKGAGTTSEPQNYRFTDSDLPYAADTLSYRLKQVDLDGTAHFTDEVVVERAGAREVVLKAPFPNPVRSRATVRYALPESQEVRLVVYDVLGRRVQTLVDDRQEAGRKEIQLNASRLSSGTYLLRLTAGGTQKSRKLTVVR